MQQGHTPFSQKPQAGSIRDGPSPTQSLAQPGRVHQGWSQLNPEPGTARQGEGRRGFCSSPAVALGWKARALLSWHELTPGGEQSTVLLDSNTTQAGKVKPVSASSTGKSWGPWYLPPVQTVSGSPALFSPELLLLLDTSGENLWSMFSAAS